MSKCCGSDLFDKFKVVQFTVDYRRYLCLKSLLAHLKHVQDLLGLVLGQVPEPDPNNLRLGSRFGVNHSGSASVSKDKSNILPPAQVL
jgi:hypothetical protein